MGWMSPSRLIDVKVIINGIHYFREDIVEFSVDDTITATGELDFGGVISDRLTIKVREKLPIPRNAKLQVYIREYETDWVWMGDYFIDTRKTEGLFTVLNCFDYLYKSNAQYTPGIKLPAGCITIMNDILDQLELPRAVLDYTTEHQYSPPYYELDESDVSGSMRNMLSIVAQVDACTLKMVKCEEFLEGFGDNGMLHFARANQLLETEHKHFTIYKKDYSQFSYSTENKKIDNVIINLGERNEFVGGVKNPRTAMKLNLKNANSHIASRIQRAIGIGANYTPFELVYRGDATLRAGNIVEIESENGTFIRSVVLSCTTHYNGGMYQVIRAGARSDTEGEFGSFDIVKEVKEHKDKLTAINTSKFRTVINHTPVDKRGVDAFDPITGQANKSLESTRIELEKGFVANKLPTKDMGSNKHTDRVVFDKQGIHLGFPTPERIANVGGNNFDRATIPSDVISSIINRTNPTGERLSSDDLGYIRQPHIFVSAREPDINLGSEGDIWIVIDLERDKGGK